MKPLAILLIASTLAGSAAAGEIETDLPGLAFDKLVWNMSAAEMKALYPKLGDRAPIDNLVYMFETPNLRTGVRFAGCAYVVSFDVVEPAHPFYGKGLDRVDLHMEKGQSARQCLVQANKALDRAVGPHAPYPGALPPPSTSWSTPRTYISSADSSGGAWITFHRRNAPVRGVIH